jgi:hypothetical protein
MIPETRHWTSGRCGLDAFFSTHVTGDVAVAAWRLNAAQRGASPTHAEQQASAVEIVWSRVYGTPSTHELGLTATGHTNPGSAAPSVTTTPATTGTKATITVSVSDLYRGLYAILHAP